MDVVEEFEALIKRNLALRYDDEGERDAIETRARTLVKVAGLDLKDFDDQLKQVKNRSSPMVFGSNVDWAHYWEKRRQLTANLLASLRDEAQASAHVQAAQDDGSKRPIKNANPSAAPGAKPNKVFIVHGHDDAMKEQVARFLEKIGIQPVILHEQPNGGKTVIEKFEVHASGVGAAVILLSPDDQAHANRTGPPLKARARQNVVLEMGYFAGLLGRSAVTALVAPGDIELPSDIVGVLYVQYDAGGAWHLPLVRELVAAGLEVDAKALLR